MASNKIYIVMKSGEELEQLKTLTAAKKLADAEGAEVYCDGECVYTAAESAVPATSAITTDDQTTLTDQTTLGDEKTILTAEPIVAKTPEQPKVDEPKVTKYRLKKLMNVRKKPSLEAEIMTTRPAGTVVRVLAVEDDWLHLADGTFILWCDGEFAEKI